MTDVRTLLHAAAAVPREPVSPQAVMKRAADRRRRRWSRWIAGALAVAAASVPATGTLLSPASDRTPVETVGIETTTTTVSEAAPTATHIDTDVHNAVPAAPTATSVEPASSDTPVSDGFSSAEPSTQGEGCEVEAADTEVYKGAFVDIGSGERGRDDGTWCTYTAMTAGSYRATGGTWRVHISRGGQPIEYSSTAGSPACLDAIAPGDHVLLSVRTADGSMVAGSRIVAGDDVTC